MSGISGVGRGSGALYIPNSDMPRAPTTAAEPTRKFTLEPPAKTPASEPVTTHPTGFEHTLDRFSHDMQVGDALISKALSGKTLAPQEILGLQVGAYRAIEEMTLATKLVESATNGVKTVIQSGGGQ